MAERNNAGAATFATGFDLARRLRNPELRSLLRWLVGRSGQQAEEAPTFAAGFEFARRLRDPEFRSLLRQRGWRPGQHVVMTIDDEPVVDVMTRVVFHETGGRAFLAIPDETEPSGFRLLLVEVAHAEIDESDMIPLGPEASIGMLSSALQPCGTYMPSEWMRALTFERVSGSA